MPSGRASWAALKQVPLNPQLTPTSSDRDGVDLYTIKVDGAEFADAGLSRPAQSGRQYPALVIYQYAGVYALQKSTLTDRAAEGWLVLDVNSHDMPPDQATAPRNYAQIGNTDREASYFLNMYLRDTRALDYIQSRPDWDGRTIVIMGTSMGGQQSFVTAGLNPGRVTAMLVDVPAGADFSGDLTGSKRGYPNWPVDDAKVVETGPLFRHHEFRARHQGEKPGGFRLHGCHLTALRHPGRLQPDPGAQGGGADAGLRPQQHLAPAGGRLVQALPRGAGIA